jgi:hypothetical protein
VRDPDTARSRHRWSRFLLIIRNGRAFSKEDLLDNRFFFENGRLVLNRLLGSERKQATQPGGGETTFRAVALE